jgi:hypothetical protein
MQSIKFHLWQGGRFRRTMRKSEEIRAPKPQNLEVSQENLLVEVEKSRSLKYEVFKRGVYLHLLRYYFRSVQ